MAQTFNQRRLAVIRQNEADLKQLFAGLSQEIGGLVVRYADPSGQIPQALTTRLREDAGKAVQARFLVLAGGQLRAYRDLPDGTIEPLSPFMRLLWNNAQLATRVGVEEHAAIMRRNLASAPDLLAAFQAATRNPFTTARAMVAEQTGFNPGRLAIYDPLHRFVHPDGYRLSDRIWRVDFETRRRMDLLLTDQIAGGRGALAMAQELEQFLLPGQQLMRTNKPYGRDASHFAMRLARTEITAAHSNAGLISAQLNPFVDGADWVRSASGRLCTTGICDELEAGSPYTLDELPNIPGASHPFCLCRYRWRVVENVAGLITGMRDDLRAARPEPSLLDLIGPLLAPLFVRFLMGYRRNVDMMEIESSI